MTDFNLFDGFMDDFTFHVDDFTSVGDVGVNTGLSNVKGFCEGVEVLTSRGWLLFEEVGDILREEHRLRGEWLKVRGSVGVPGGLDERDEFVLRSRFGYDPLLVASVSPYRFDEGVLEVPSGVRGRGRPKGSADEDVLKRSGGSGRVVFVQPRGFYQWDYSRSTVRLKKRGLDVRSTVFVEYPVKRKYRSGYGFVRADEIYGNRYGEYFYLMLNKFSRDVGKEFNPSKSVVTGDKVREWWWGKDLDSLWWEYRAGVAYPPSRSANQSRAWFLREVSRSFVPGSVVPSEVYVMGRGSELYPAEHARVSNGYDGLVFNLDVPPYKTLVVREERPRLVDGGVSKKHWSGVPVVAGDVSNKSVPPGSGYRKPDEEFWV